MENLSIKILKNQTVHFIGIGGISMSALALMLKSFEVIVQGSDDQENEETLKLQKRGVKVFLGHSKKNLKGVQFVVYSSAINDKNEELVYAKKKGLTLIKRAELLGLVAEGFKTVISVSGSHGKTTATAMIAEMFLRSGLKPTVHIGGKLNSIKSNYKIGNKKFFITESCEYKENFLFLKPDISIVLNIDADHLDYFSSLENVKMSFVKFAKNTKSGGFLIVSKDDVNSKDLFQFENVVSFGFDKGADLVASNIKEYKPCYYSFDVIFSRLKLGNIKLNVLGRHNIYNALVCVMVGLAIAIDFCDIKNAIEKFSGVVRRCQRINTKLPFDIYHDYAHHPEQIEKMILVARDLTRKSEGRVIVVFEPHTYSRTKFLIQQFVDVLAKSDYVFLAPVYSAREVPTDGYDSLKLSNELKQKNNNVAYIETYAEMFDRVKEFAKPKDVVMILGAGTIDKFAKMFEN